MSFRNEVVCGYGTHTSFQNLIEDQLQAPINKHEHITRCHNHRLR